MKQIYIHTNLGTTRIDYDDKLPGDIIISASTLGHVYGVIQEHVEVIGIDHYDEQHTAEARYAIMPISYLQELNTLIPPTYDQTINDSVTSYGHQHDTEYVND
jgi:hypothetical protein